MIGRGPADRLEHRHALGVQVRPRRDAHPALDHRAQVGEDVAEHVVGDDHVEPGGVLDEVDAGGVDVDVVRRHVRAPLGHLRERARPQVSRVVQDVRLVGHGHAAAPSGLAGQLEGVAQAPVHPAPGVDALLGRDLLPGSPSGEPAGADVEALGVLPDEDHVDVLLLHRSNRQ